MTNRLNEAIDRAVRDMMHVDAPVDVARRVLTSLDHPRTRVRPWVLAATGASVAAAVLLAFVIMRSSFMVEPPSVAARALSGPGAAPRPSRIVRVDDFPQSVRFRPVTAAVAPEPAPTIPALREIAPLVVSPPEHADIEPGAVVIAPLDVIPDVRIDPLPFPPGSRE